MNKAANTPPTERIPIIGRSRMRVKRYYFIVNRINGKEDWNWEPKRYMPPIGWCRFISMPPKEVKEIWLKPLEEKSLDAPLTLPDKSMIERYAVDSPTWNGEPRRGEVFNQLKKQLE